MKYGLITAALITVAAIVPAAAEERAFEDVIDDVNASVVSIVADIDEEQALGAGIVAIADDYVITNAHVVNGAHKITVTTIYDDSYQAELVGSDEKTDIALLKLEQASGLNPVEFSDSDMVRVGNGVFAIGNPYGLGNSVSQGIISAKERDIEKGPYDNFLQTDAAINQGNSGGPLFNLSGEVIGMNTAIFSEDGQNMGLGFATPANTVQWVVDQLKLHGRVVRGWLGIGVRQFRSRDNNTGQLAIASMAENSPAAKAGLQVGDVIERLGNISLKNARIFSAEVAETAPQTVLPMVVSRDGQIIKTVIKVVEMPAEEKTPPAETAENGDVAQLLRDAGLPESLAGAEVWLAELQLRAVYDEKQQNFFITGIDEGAPLAALGVEVGNRLLTVDGKKIFGSEDLQVKITAAQTAQKPLQLQVADSAGVDTITLKLKDKTDESH